MFGRRAFSLSGPAAWNSLPDYPRDPSRSVDSFRKELKTFIFSFYKRTQRIRGFAIVRYVKLLLTLTLTLSSYWSKRFPAAEVIVKSYAHRQLWSFVVRNITRYHSFYRAMLCIRGTSHGPVSVRPSVRHESVFY